ncbi:MAG: TPM domain-containing protein [Candidatus Omnitrophica bacterium]|nr:TPM domain-containing protein [Candidatus Omnitrophota bacterium]MBU1894787.1 TPM domain-containing protein [Candidatus Omnitrophota bacterium]
MKKILLFSVLVIGCLFCVNVFCGENINFPKPAGFVTDTAGIIPQKDKIRIETLAYDVEKQTQIEIAVVTIETTSPYTIEQYAVKLFSAWGIGKKGKDNGILVLVASLDRKVRIEVGYGLEGVITDLHSKLIISDLILPYFRQGDYGLGVLSGTVAIAQTISKEYNVEFSSYPDSQIVKKASQVKKGSAGGSLLTLLFFLLIFGFRFGTMFFLMSTRPGYWSGGSGGSFGGGFGGFGGGMSGGGGASGGW